MDGNNRKPTTAYRCQDDFIPQPPQQKNYQLASSN